MVTKSQEEIVNIIGKMTILELADLVKAIETEFGVSAASMVASTGAASTQGSATAAVQEEKSEYKITLKDSGSDKIKVIKALRKVVPSLNLTDAKSAVENVPTVIVESASKEDAKKIKEELEAAGATIELS
ncbi:MAG TPA: 50S ribosomal protein L7/L12 [Candidatus Babeliales bacterium]|nr:50S ribosomal protein L7/L12 [Candidatus Babeliales bacterium]